MNILKFISYPALAPLSLQIGLTGPSPIPSLATPLHGI